ncbi:MAG: thioredoxin domain-containing protein [Polyangiales bacterium]
MQPDLPPPPPPPPPPPAPRSAYFVPPPAPPAAPRAPAFAGVGTIFVTLGALVAVAFAALFVLPAILSKKPASTEQAHDEERPRPKPEPSAKKKTVDAEAAKILPILETDPVLGTDDALVTIVAFDDFQCPYCKRAEATLDALRIKYGTKLRVVWKDNPLPFHKDARPAARMARVAFLAGGNAAYWPLHDKVFANVSSIGTDLEAWGKAAGADATAIARFGTDADTQIDDSIALAKTLGASGTPTFFVDGERLVGAQPQASFETVIDAHLAEAQKMLDDGTPLASIYAKLVEKHYDEPATPASSVHAVDLTGAPQWGPPDALVTVVLFGDLDSKLGFDAFVPSSVAAMPDTRLVFRDHPSTPNGRAASAIVRAIGTRYGDARRLDAIEEIWASSFVPSPLELESLAGRYGIPSATARAIIAASPASADIDADLDYADEVSASTGNQVYVNGVHVASTKKTDLATAHATAKKAADKLVAAGTAPIDVYEKTIKGGIKSTAKKHAVIPVPSWAPMRGPKTAKVTIQVFADFQCPFCARAMTGDFAKAVAAHPGDVNVVFRQMPLVFHPLAEPAAQLVFEAMAQKGGASFWRVHDALFAGGTPLTTTKMDAVATAEGLDLPKVHAAQATHKYKTSIDADVADATKAGISGTPTFLVGDEIVNGAVPLATFEAAIRRQLTKLKPPPAPIY